MLRTLLAVIGIATSHGACCRIVCAPGYAGKGCAPCKQISRPTPPYGVNPNPDGQNPYTPYLKFLDIYGDEYDRLRKCGECTLPSVPSAMATCEEALDTLEQLQELHIRYMLMYDAAQYTWLVVHGGTPWWGGQVYPGWSSYHPSVPQELTSAVLAYLGFIRCIKNVIVAIDDHLAMVWQVLDECGPSGWTPSVPFGVDESAWSAELERVCPASDSSCARERQDTCPYNRVWCCDVVGCESPTKACASSACCKTSCDLDTRPIIIPASFGSIATAS